MTGLPGASTGARCAPAAFFVRCYDIYILLDPLDAGLPRHRRARSVPSPSTPLLLLPFRALRPTVLTVPWQLSGSGACASGALPLAVATCLLRSPVVSAGLLCLEEWSGWQGDTASVLWPFMPAQSPEMDCTVHARTPVRPRGDPATDHGGHTEHALAIHSRLDPHTSS